MNIVTINGQKIGCGNPVFIVAEISANHNQDFENAADLIRIAKEAGANAVKLQTYTPDTITVDSDKEYFKIKGTIWQGETLYSLYKKAYTPWEWFPELKGVAEDEGIVFFSTPFDKTAVDFLEELKVPAYKIASFELVDTPLIEHIAKRGKPIVISTGMATLGEIEEAFTAARDAGAKEIALLKCTSAYPSPLEDVNLKTIPHMMETFEVPVGLSDHTLTASIPIAAVALGASIIEKHITLSRKNPTPDAAFSLEPEEFKIMVKEIREVEEALGDVSYRLGKKEGESRLFRRSLFITRDTKAGETITEENVRSIRPACGLHPKHLKDVLGRKAKVDLATGTPLHWFLIE